MALDHPRAQRLHHLQRLHRLEEVAERFGLPLEQVESADGELARLRFDRLSHVRVDGRRLSAAAAAGRAKSAGLEVDEAGIALPLDGSLPLERLEDRLLGFLDGLYRADPEPFVVMPPREIAIPTDGTLPRSGALLERFYGGDFLPREKKPAVIDLRRSQGPYLRSVDDDPLQIVDSASQIASHAAGVRPAAAQAALDEGAFDPYLGAAPPPAHPISRPAVSALRDAIRAVASPGLRYVTFCNGGAEANEKAFHLARQNGPGGRRILAFHGSFHGRTLLALYSTWNPIKRAPYQLPGFETEFLPFPLPDDPTADPPIPDGWRQAWRARDGRRDWDGDDLLALEAKVLAEAEKQIVEGDVLALTIEPYQCEGGDRPATRRFFHGLRALTRAYGVPLIFDEVQSGFGLGGPVFWHQKFRLLDANGDPDGPDLVVGAKRAQVGYVLSRWPDPTPTSSHVASMVRGKAHLDMVRSIPGHAAQARGRLKRLMQAWPDIVTRARVVGDAFAFDLPSKSIANHLIGQRFYRGYMVYIAGERTLRYRLNRGMTPADVDRIFDVIHASLTALVEQAGGDDGDLDDLVRRMGEQSPPAWDGPPEAEAPAGPDLAVILGDESGGVADRVLRVEGELSPVDREAGAAMLGLGADVRGPGVIAAVRSADAAAFEAKVGVSLVRFAADALGTRVRVIGAEAFADYADQIESIQSEAYEPARRDAIALLKLVTASRGGLCVIAEDPAGLVGYTFGAPLELWPSTDGPSQDPHRGALNTLYSADMTVAPRARGRGVGWRLRAAMIRAALAERRSDGRPRYAYIAGRNRMGEAAAMWRLNQRFGAYEVARYPGQYGAPSAMTRYYRLPLRRHDRRPFEGRPQHARVGQGRVDAADGVALPTGLGHPLLERARRLGVFDESALTKMTVSNFITPPYARYAEWLRHRAPRGLGHMYFTSCADEMVDKTIRVLKHTRKAGHQVIGFVDGDFGHTTAASRSLTAPGGDSPLHGFFDWPLVPHPADGIAQTIAALDAVVERFGADHILGLFCEGIQARTGRALDAAAWDALVAWREKTGVPLVLSETHSGFYRAGGGRFWWADGQSAPPNAVLWWAGGQIGHIFVDDATYVAKPLAFISTWDGDPLSATRLHYQMFAVDPDAVAARSAQLSAGLRALGLAPEVRAGRGLYRVLRLGAWRAERVQAALARVGVDVARPAPDTLALAPALTIGAAQIDRLVAALALALAET